MLKILHSTLRCTYLYIILISHLFGEDHPGIDAFINSRKKTDQCLLKEHFIKKEVNKKIVINERQIGKYGIPCLYLFQFH